MTLGTLARERLRERRWEVWGYLGTGFMAYLSPAVLFGLSAYLISKAALKPGILTLGVVIGSVRFFALARGASQYGERMWGHSLTLDLAARIRTLLFDRLAAVVPYRVRPGVFGEVLASLNGDMTQLENLAARLVGPATGVGLASLVVVVIAGAVSPVFVVVLLPSLLLIGLVVPFGAYRLARSGAQSTSVLRAQAYDTSLATAATFQSRYFLRRGDPLLDQLKHKTFRLLRPQRRQAGIQTWLGVFNGVIEATALTATLWIGADLMAAHRLDAVELAVIPFLILAIVEGLTAVGLEAATAGSGTPAVARLERTLALQGRDCSRCSQTTLPLSALTIECEDVSFHYPDADREILHSFELHLEGGQRLLVVGPTGSGKSTLAAMVLGAWTPTAGVMRIGGIPTTELSEETIAASIAYLSSEPYLFGASLAANLRLARAAASDAELIDALGRVGLGPWFAELSDGLATMMGQDNRMVSQGEKQRLALARLLVLNPKNLVLDEPTAGLDAENEQIVAEILNAQFEGATIMVITHSEAFMEAFHADHVRDFGEFVRTSVI
ncbi:thiol reductant ABC exporter subunit CydC [Ferrimicrobium sp.]|uniref:thiol reductant ABC exporter subunit CydC n=1 Tax=Ferrimicrobium sp. TaxID=2926050 RepID=UPI00262FE4BD|nr:thiol reductant ABC exporter subunit CydC [Ferrimicrobium sp.]